MKTFTFITVSLLTLLTGPTALAAPTILARQAAITPLSGGRTSIFMSEAEMAHMQIGEKFPGEIASERIHIEAEPEVISEKIHIEAQPGKNGKRTNVEVAPPNNGGDLTNDKIHIEAN